MSKSTTLVEVAQRAGVSIATVSRVLRNNGYVASDTQAKIRSTRLLIAGCGLGASTAICAARMGFTEPCFSDSDDDLARQAFKASDPRAAGLDWDTLKTKGFQRLAVPSPWAPFAQGNFPTPSGRCAWSAAAPRPR